MSTAFQDISPFAGWRQFRSFGGLEFRAEYMGESAWAVFTREGDAFIRSGSAEASIDATCREIHKAWLQGDAP